MNFLLENWASAEPRGPASKPGPRREGFCTPHVHGADCMTANSPPRGILRPTPRRTRRLEGQARKEESSLRSLRSRGLGQGHQGRGLGSSGSRQAVGAHLLLDHVLPVDTEEEPVLHDLLGVTLGASAVSLGRDGHEHPLPGSRNLGDGLSVWALITSNTPPLTSQDIPPPQRRDLGLRRESLCPGSEPGDSNLAPGTGMQAERAGPRRQPLTSWLCHPRPGTPPCSSASPGSSRAGRA